MTYVYVYAIQRQPAVMNDQGRACWLCSDFFVVCDGRGERLTRVYGCRDRAIDFWVHYNDIPREEPLTIVEMRTKSVAVAELCIRRLVAQAKGEHVS